MFTLYMVLQLTLTNLHLHRRRGQKGREDPPVEALEVALLLLQPGCVMCKCLNNSVRTALSLEIKKVR